MSEPSREELQARIAELEEQAGSRKKAVSSSKLARREASVCMGSVASQ